MSPRRREPVRSVTIRSIRRGVRAAIRNNASPYAYSVLITATYGIVARELGAPSQAEIFLFVTGAACAFASIEAVVSRGFRDRLLPEPAEVVVLGSALALVSISSSLAAAWIASRWLAGPAGWIVAPFIATVAYLIISGAELALAHQAEARPARGHARRRRSGR